MIRTLALIFASVLGITLPNIPLAQANCAPRDVVITRLAERYGEVLRSAGLNSNGNLVETYASLEAATWTVVISDPAGRSCVVAAGTAFEIFGEPGENGAKKL